MAQHTVSSTALIHAPAHQLYAIIADYRDGHPHILPKPPFVSLAVERGGVGAGTAISFQMRLLGKVHTTHATITEPEPGRRLVESTDNGIVTTFFVEPRDDGHQASVTITTVSQVRDGILGSLEGWLTTRLLQPTYVKELRQLADFAAQRPV